MFHPPRTPLEVAQAWPPILWLWIQKEVVPHNSLERSMDFVLRKQMFVYNPGRDMGLFLSCQSHGLCPWDIAGYCVQGVAGETQLGCVNPQWSSTHQKESISGPWLKLCAQLVKSLRYVWLEPIACSVDDHLYFLALRITTLQYTVFPPRILLWNVWLDIQFFMSVHVLHPGLPTEMVGPLQSSDE